MTKPRVLNAASFRPAERGIEQILGGRQASIMHALWDHGAMTPGGLRAVLKAASPVAYTTIHTELMRLVKKGLVNKPSGGNAEYKASLAREAFARDTVTQVLRGLIQAHGAAAIHGFVNIVANDAEAYDELRRAVRRKKQK